MFHFFAHKLASLGAGRFAFALVFARSFDCFFFWHNKMVSPLEGRLDVNKKSGGSYLPPVFCFKRTSLIVRLVDRHPVDRHLVFHARAAGVHVPDVHAPVCRDLAVVRLSVRGRSVCSVRLDFVVCPSCLSLLLNRCLGLSHFAIGLFNQIGVESDLD
jgi:hypothetical protein